LTEKRITASVSAGPDFSGIKQGCTCCLRHCNQVSDNSWQSILQAVPIIWALPV